MRDIKFRAWDMEFKKWSDIALQTKACDIKYATDYEWNQYIGVKDCNGNEIYEGDILEDFINNQRYSVVWDDYGMFLFHPNGSTSGSLDYYQLEEVASIDCLVVIGNIYENIELLGS